MHSMETFLDSITKAQYKSSVSVISIQLIDSVKVSQVESEKNVLKKRISYIVVFSIVCCGFNKSRIRSKFGK